MFAPEDGERRTLSGPGTTAGLYPWMEVALDGLRMAHLLHARRPSPRQSCHRRSFASRLQRGTRHVRFRVLHAVPSSDATSVSTAAAGTTAASAVATATHATLRQVLGGMDTSASICRQTEVSVSLR